MPLLEGPGVGVLCLIEDGTLSAVARNDEPHWPARALPERVGSEAARARRRGLRLRASRSNRRCSPRWSWRRSCTSGLVLALPVRGGVLGLLVLACPRQTFAPGARRARGARHAARARARGRPADRGDPRAAQRGALRLARAELQRPDHRRRRRRDDHLPEPVLRARPRLPARGAARHPLRPPRRRGGRRPAAAAARRRLGLRAPRRRR